MERTAAGEAAFRDSSPTPAPACAPAPGEHNIPFSDAPRLPPGNVLTAASHAAAVSVAAGGRAMTATRGENGLLLRRACLTLGYPPRKRRFAFWREPPGEQR